MWVNASRRGSPSVTAHERQSRDRVHPARQPLPECNQPLHAALRVLPKFNGEWTVQDYRLRLHGRAGAGYQDPAGAAGEPGQYREVVFCGLGEPSLRLYTVLEVGTELRRLGVRVRLNTDGLANLVHGGMSLPIWRTASTRCRFP